MVRLVARPMTSTVWVVMVCSLLGSCIVSAAFPCMVAQEMLEVIRQHGGSGKLRLDAQQRWGRQQLEQIAVGVDFGQAVVEGEMLLSDEPVSELERFVGQAHTP